MVTFPPTIPTDCTLPKKTQLTFVAKKHLLASALCPIAGRETTSRNASSTWCTVGNTSKAPGTFWNHWNHPAYFQWLPHPFCVRYHLESVTALSRLSILALLKHTNLVTGTGTNQNSKTTTSMATLKAQTHGSPQRHVAWYSVAAGDEGPPGLKMEICSGYTMEILCSPVFMNDNSPNLGK